MTTDRTEHAELLPNDAYDAKLLANVRPPDWKNPQPAPSYNLVVLGAGTAGLVTAAGAAGLGAKVALVERNLLGGDCLNVGCVPSKALLRSARFYADLHHAPRFTGNAPVPSDADFAAAMERMRRLRAHISRHDSAQRFRGLGVDVFLGDAAFADRRTVEVAGATLQFKKAVIATGTRAAAPPIEGLEEAGYLTNETVFNSTERPRRLLVIGGGPARLRAGSGLRAPRLRGDHRQPGALLPPRRGAGRRGDPRRRVAERRHRGAAQHGGEERHPAGREKRVRLVNDGEEATVAVDEILIGVGRVPNVEGLNLEAAGVEYDHEHGVRVNDYLQTTNRRIYAAGDVALEHKFTHTADATARIVIQNALFWGRKKLSVLDDSLVHLHRPGDRPRGHVREGRAGAGLPDRHLHRADERRGPRDPRRRGGGLRQDPRPQGHRHDPRRDHRRAPRGGDDQRDLPGDGGGDRPGDRRRVIHSYPTQAEAIRKAGDAYNRTRLSPFLKALSSRWLAWSR